MGAGIRRVPVSAGRIFATRAGHRRPFLLCGVLPLPRRFPPDSLGSGQTLTFCNNNGNLLRSETTHISARDVGVSGHDVLQGRAS
jgi:hypothetical protein